jgi:hypothetical protein
MSRRRSVFDLLLVAVALATIVGHICVLPGHVHAAPGTEAHDHKKPVSDDHDPTAGADAASCEAVRTPTVAAAVPILVASSSIAVLGAIVHGVIDRASDSPVPTSSPPLYLAHRALLI